MFMLESTTEPATNNCLMKPSSLYYQNEIERVDEHNHTRFYFFHAHTLMTVNIRQIYSIKTIITFVHQGRVCPLQTLLLSCTHKYGGKTLSTIVKLSGFSH